MNCTFKSQVTSRNNPKATLLQKPLLKDKMHSVIGSWVFKGKRHISDRYDINPHKFQSYDFNSTIQSRDCAADDHKITTKLANKSVYLSTGVTSMN